MDQTLKVFAGIGLGVGLMYFLDPGRGRRRRALTRDRVNRLAHEARHAADVAARDATNRARGAWAGVRVAEQPPDDRTLTARVRSHLGRCVSHPRAVEVTADRGKIILSGPILAYEVDDLIACVSGVVGVREVENRLDVHEEAGNHPSLQGGVPRTGARSEPFQANWSPTLRLLAGTAGIGLVGNCLVQRGLGSTFLGVVGFGFLLRAATNTSFAELVAQAVPVPLTEGPAPLAVAAAGPVL